MTTAAKQNPVRTFPANGEIIDLQNLDAVACKYVTPNGMAACIAYKGKRKKPEFHFTFKDVDARDGYLKQWIEQMERKRQQDADYAARVEAEHNAFVASLTVGSIFYRTWGYEQTNADFYEVVGKVTRTHAEVREIAQDVTEHSPGAMAGYAIPRKGEYTSDTKKIGLRRICPQQWTEGKKVSVSWYG